LGSHSLIAATRVLPDYINEINVMKLQNNLLKVLLAYYSKKKKDHTPQFSLTFYFFVFNNYSLYTKYLIQAAIIVHYTG
jgi:hypothetical protein